MKNKTIIFSIMFLVLAFTISGCGLSKEGSKNNLNVAVESVSTSTISIISITNFAFNPETLKIKKGTTITWTNNDPMPHQIKSTLFSSDILNKGQNFSFTFNEIGNFNYYCAIHPSMTGQIIVE